MGNEIPGNPYLKQYDLGDTSPTTPDPVQSEPLEELPPEEFVNEYENFDDGEAPLGEDYDSFVGFDEGGAGGGYTRQAGNEMIQDFWTWLQDSDLTGADRQNIATQIREAEGFIANSSGDQLTAEAQNALSALQARIHGGSEVGMGDDPFGLDELIVDEDSGDGNLTEELQNFKTSLASMTNLTPEKRGEYESQIDQWLSNLNLGTGDADQIWELFDTLKSEVNDLAAFSPTEQSFGEALGIGAEAAHALLEKHGIDPNNLPPPDDSRILALLSDPELDGIQAAANGISTAENNLEEFIELNRQQAGLENQTRESDTSNNVKDSKDVTVFKNLWEASKHEDDRSVDLIDAHEKFGKEVAKVLTALYGEEATVTEGDADRAGVVNFDGKNYRFNILGTGEIETTGDLDIDWPDVVLVEWRYDAEGSGNLGRPQWVKDAGYPASSYDGGGGSRST